MHSPYVRLHATINLTRECQQLYQPDPDMPTSSSPGLFTNT